MQTDLKELFVDGRYLDEKRDIVVSAIYSEAMPGYVAYSAFAEKTGRRVTAHVESVLVMMAQLHLFAKAVRGETS